MGGDDDSDRGEKLQAPPDFDGPTAHRHCTDVLCLLLIVAMWVSMTGLGIYAVNNGDYRVLIYPMDYDGNICGIDWNSTDMTDYPKLYYVNNFGGGVCINKCPALENQTSNDLTDVRTLITYAGLWQDEGAELPPDYVQVGDYSNSSNAVACTQDTCFPNNSPKQSWYSQGIRAGFGYAYYTADSYEVFGRCLLTSAAQQQIYAMIGLNYTVNITSIDAVQKAQNFWSNLYGDIYAARAYILGFGFGVGLAVALGYTLLLRLPFLLSFVIWGSIFLCVAMFVGLGFFATNQADTWENQSPQTVDERAIQGTRYFGYCMWGFGAFFALLGCCLRNQIQLAVGCIKEAAKAVESMILIFFVPVLQAVGFISFLIVWIVYAVYLASLGNLSSQEYPIDPTNPDLGTFAIRTYTYTDFVFQSAWYLLFCLFWTGNFIVAIGEVVIAMSIAKWYFTRNKLLVTSATVIGSVCDTCLYHLGTCAYGSLIVAIIQFLRAVLMYIQRKLKGMASLPANIIICCCQCCLWCLEKCVKFLNKNAYIQTAIFGYSFCRAAREAFFLILRNIARIGAISYVSAAVLIIGKLFISVVTTGLAYFALLDQLEGQLHSVAGPLLLIFFIAYLISDMFMSIFHMAILTVLQCFIADEEMFHGDECYAEGDLRGWIDKHAGMFG